MTNNQFCNFLGCLGCVIAFFSMGLMFFGVSLAVWGAVVGIVMGGIAIVSYN